MDQHYKFLNKIHKLLKLKSNKAIEYAKRNKINVNKLYAYRKHVNELDPVNETLLHYLIYRYYQTKKHLLNKFIKDQKKKGKNIHSESAMYLFKNSRFVLQFHKQGYYKKFVKLLHKCIKVLKCDLNINNSLGQNVMYYAMDLGVPDIAYHLDKFYSNRYGIQDIIKDSEMVSIAYYNDFPNFVNESINILNPNKLYTNRISLLNFKRRGIVVGNFEAPLHFISDNIKVVKALLERGANPNYRLMNHHKLTLLHIASYLAKPFSIQHLIELIELFNEYNYDFDLIASGRETPLHLLLNELDSFVHKRRVNPDYIMAVILMLKGMDNPNAVNYKQVSVIDLIIEYKLWPKVQKTILSPDYKPFIDLCKKHGTKNIILLDTIDNISNADKLEILFQLTKKYYCAHYIKWANQTKGGSKIILLGGSTKIHCNKITDVLFKDLGSKFSKILFSICNDKDRVNTYAKYSRRLSKHLSTIKVFINKLKKVVTYDWCKFHFVEKLPAQLLQILYVALNEYIKHPVDASLDILVNPKTKEKKCRYVFTTGTLNDDIFGLVYLQKKFKNVCCKYLLDYILKLYEHVLTHPLVYHRNDNIVKESLIFYNSDTNHICNVKKWTEFAKKCMRGKKRYFISTIGIFGKFGGHANALIIDNKNKTIERFEPHGAITNVYNMNEFDKNLRKFFSKINKNYRYVSPKDFEPEYSLQGLSAEGLEGFRKIGDPGGFCLTWSLAYIDLRLSNPDIPPKKLLDSAINIIHNKGLRIVDYIRLYTKIIYRLREDILETVELTYDDLLAFNMTPEQGKKIIKLMKI